jgi:hypothetical protein
MPVRIGRIELVGLSNIYTEDTRSLVKQRGPGQTGGVFQDLGREPVTVVMEGILLGDDTQAELEELREAQAKAKPLSFAADAIAGAELTEVVIADLQVKQLAGHQSRFAFFLRVREYTEPPEPAGAGAAAVDAGVAADAAAWQQGSLDAAAVLQDPGSLMEKVGENPSLLQHLSAGDLGSVVSQTAGSLTGKNFGELLGALGKVNPAIIGDFIDVLKNGGDIGAFIQKLAAEGVNVLEQLTGVNLGAALAVLKGIAGASDFLAKLQRVVGDATALVDQVGKFDPLAPFKDLTPGGGT